MSKKFLMLICRIIILTDNCLRVLRAKIKDKKVAFSLLDKTGHLVSEASSIPIYYKGQDIIIVFYKKYFSHSLWRSQEFSLFYRHKNILKRPLLDFGCGDGSFSSVLFEKINYGVDIDEDALKVAAKYKIYDQLICISYKDSNIPLRTESVGSVFSNSVLEHVIDLEKIISEIYRVLVKGGIFMFTVPTIQFKVDLATYFGNKDSERINEQFYHRHLLEEAQWIKLLQDMGFTIVNFQPYQPYWFTIMYRLINSFGLWKIMGLKMPPHFLKRLFIKIIKNSTFKTKKGGNIFVVAEKK